MDTIITNFKTNFNLKSLIYNVFRKLNEKLKIFFFKNEESDEDGSDTVVYLKEWDLEDLNDNSEKEKDKDPEN